MKIQPLTSTGVVLCHNEEGITVKWNEKPKQKCYVSIEGVMYLYDPQLNQFFPSE